MTDRLAFFYDILDREIGNNIQTFVEDDRTTPTIENIKQSDTIYEELMDDLRYRQEKIWYSILNYLTDIRDYGSENNIVEAMLIKGTGMDVPTAPTYNTQGTAGGMANGDYYYKVSFYNVDDDSDSNLSLESSVMTLSSTFDQLRINIPVDTSGVPGTIHRKIWRRYATGENEYKLVGIVADNTTTTFDDLLTDTGLYKYQFEAGISSYNSPTYPKNNTGGLTDAVIQAGQPINASLKGLIVDNENAFYSAKDTILDLLEKIRDEIIANSLSSNAELKGKRKRLLTLDLISSIYTI